MNKSKQKARLRKRRHRRVRRRVEGTAEKPRMCVFRSNKHIYVQVIDDWAGRTLAAASTQAPELRGKLKHGGSIEGAVLVGEMIGRRCVAQGISRIAFDRGGFQFHGRIKALADAARAQFKEAKLPGF